MKTIKCENCGANMTLDNEQKVRFCSFCGAAIKLSEDYIDFEKYKLNHQEEVRQRIKKESNHDQKRSFLIGALSVIFFAGLVFCGIYFGEDATIDRLANEVQQLIIAGDYEAAAIKVEGIRVEKKSWFIDDHFNKYENLRNDLKKLIEQKKRESQ